MSVSERFQNKRVLITGTTGFLGKVLLEKFLYSLPQVEKIYVLIRAKQGSNLYERFKKQVISSPCFDRIRDIHKGKFNEFIQTKVVPIQGDLLKEQLGLSKEVQTQLVEKCQVVLNCAASIDFNARIDQAIDSNIRGSMRMLELARKIKHLEVFTHISTCYVNCDMRGLIKEEIFQKEHQCEEQLKYLQSLPLNELIANTSKILGNYPNTYTYTKNLCERLMRKRQAGLPVCIVRPAIINTSYSQPFPGWIDSIAAAAAIFLFVGLGIIKELKGPEKRIGDTIPVDFVANTIIVASALNFKVQTLPIYHVGSSDRNPLTWGEMKVEVLNYWNSAVSESKVGKASVLFSENENRIFFRRLKRNLPASAYLRLGPILGKQHQKKAQKLIKTLKRGEDVANIFEFFVKNQWIYECRNFKRLWQFLTPEERKVFAIDIGQIDAKQYIRINNYGIQKYILKEHAEPPGTPNSNLLRMRTGHEYFSDIKWALGTDIPINQKKVINEIRTKILNSTRVIKIIQHETQKMSQKNSTDIGACSEKVKKMAEKIIQDLVAQAKVPVLRTMAWTLHKAFKNLFEKININLEMLQQIRKIQKNTKLPIVLLPTHRSYLDFLLVSYVFFVYNLRLPNFVADEAILQANLLPFIIKNCGAFFFQKTYYQDSRLYKIIFDKYIQLLLKEGNTLQFFIEGARSRTGKILAPKFQILNIVLDSLQYEKIPDVCIIPMTVNYEKVLEGDTFPGQLLGEQKVAESFMRLVKALPQIKVNHGRVYIQICKPFMAKQFINSIKAPGQKDGPQTRKKIIKYMGRQIISRMTNGIVIMGTAVVSSVLLMHRKGISEDVLIKTVNELIKYIIKKGYKVGGVNQNSSAVAVRNAIGFLSGITTKTKKNIFELTISAGGQFQKILMLSYYRNTLTHAFLPEAFIGCSIAAFGQQLNMNEGVLIPRVQAQVDFLTTLLKEEYFMQYNFQNEVDFMNGLQKMKDNSIIQIKEGKVLIIPSGTRMIAFFCSLLRSQIQCYWATMVYLITIAKNQDRRYETSSLNKFYDTVQWFMESLFEQKVIEDYDACSLESIKNTFDKYNKSNIIRITPGGKKKQSVVEVLVSIEELQGLENKIKFFRKTVYSSVISPTEVAKQSLRELSTTPKL